MEKVPMTVRGARELEDQLRDLRRYDRPAVLKAIAEARAHGDLSENAEYHAAREQQGLIEGRIAELEDVLSRANVIDVDNISSDAVRFGTTVTLIDEETEEQVTYQIVGPYEADLDKGLISISSPIAKALIGKSLGDSAEVMAPAGARSYEVVGVMVK